MQDLQRLVDQADEAGLLEAVDGLCASREWDTLADLARRCRDAVEWGKQLWGVAMHIDYRLALEAPPASAGAVLTPGAGRFTFGPLTEVAANRLTWAELAPHLGNPACRDAVAQERVIRGEDLRGHDHDLRPELPLRLAGFEPRYALPVYRDREAQFPEPVVATEPVPPASAQPAGHPLEPDDACAALRATTETWVSQSQGTSRAVVVAGDACEAVGALSQRAGLLPISSGQALAVLQWAGASGGAHGRRPGGAAGRFAAWWAAAACAGLSWPAEPGGLEAFTAALAEALEDLRWYRWQPPAPASGWALRIAVADPVDGLAWAVEAIDQPDEPDAEQA